MSVRSEYSLIRAKQILASLHWMLDLVFALGPVVPSRYKK